MRYGMSPRWLLPDHTSFRTRHQQFTENVLTLTPAAKEVVNKIQTGTIDRRPEIPKILWDNLRVRIPGNGLIRILAFGGLGPELREKCEISWSRLDERKLDTIEALVRNLWPRESTAEWPNDIPDPRYHPRAQEGIRYAKNSRHTLYAAAKAA